MTSFRQFKTSEQFDVKSKSLHTPKPETSQPLLKNERQKIIHFSFSVGVPVTLPIMFLPQKPLAHARGRVEYGSGA